MTRDLARTNQQKEESILYAVGKEREKKIADCRYNRGKRRVRWDEMHHFVQIPFPRQEKRRITFFF